MKLDDALIVALIDGPALGEAVDGLARNAIAGGADMLVVRPGTISGEALAALAGVCREEDAILVFVDDVERAAGGADGVLFMDVAAPIAIARAVLGTRALLGMAASNARDAQLAREVDADFLVYDVAAAGDGAAVLRDAGSVPVYAAGLRSANDARAAVDDGYFRLCVPLGADSAAAREHVATFARMIGRTV